MALEGGGCVACDLFGSTPIWKNRENGGTIQGNASQEKYIRLGRQAAVTRTEYQGVLRLN